MKFKLLNIRQWACLRLFFLLLALAPYGQAKELEADSCNKPPVAVAALGDGVEGEPEQLGPVDRRIRMERLTRANRFLLTPHRRNYILPISYHDKPNNTPYLNGDSSLADLNNTEAEIQFSIKVLMRENIFGHNGHLYLGYTNHAFWQIYSEKDSAPFRETNHEPELILGFYSNIKLFGFRNVLNEVILNHQSNGQGGLLSRSWNRVMVRSVLERGNLALAIAPWYRIPEDAKTTELDPDGDDNPDITDYLGYFKFDGAYKHKENIYSVALNNNFAKSNSTVELGWSFPMTRNVRGFARYFDGYGYSLIDYNSRQQVFSLGVVFTDIF